MPTTLAVADDAGGRQRVGLFPHNIIGNMEATPAVVVAAAVTECGGFPGA